jgi:predicted acyltransferase
MLEPKNTGIASKRYLSIDIFKGISIIFMVFVNTLRPYESIPDWNKHAVVYGITYVDLVAPFFVFLLAIDTHLSYSKRLKLLGRKHAIIHHLRRFLIFIIIGLILSIDIESNTLMLRWGTLQILGTSGLLLLILIELKYYIRLIFAVIALTIHQFILTNGFAQRIYDSVEGGVYSIFAWGAMVLLSSVLYESMKQQKKKNYMLIGSILFIISGIILSYSWKISRQYVSVSYVLLSVGISAVLFNIIYTIFDSSRNSMQISIKGNFILNLGRNAFFLYLFHIILIYMIYEILPFDAPEYLVFLIAGVNVVIIYFIGYFMDRYKVYLVI